MKEPTFGFSPSFFTDLRSRLKMSAREKSSTLIQEILSKEENLLVDGPDGVVVDFELLADLLIDSKLVASDEEVVRYKITQLVESISNIKPAVRQPKPGVYVVVGKKGMGKSTWLRQLMEMERVDSQGILINHDEPKLVTDILGTSSGLGELLVCMDHVASINAINTIALDGIRTIQYESTGNTLSGGVNSGFFRFLTDIGNAAVDAGIVCIFTYNPNTEKDEAYNVVAAMVDGSVQGIIDMNESVIRSRYHKRESYPLDESYSILFDDTADAVEDAPIKSIEHTTL